MRASVSLVLALVASTLAWPAWSLDWTLTPETVRACPGHGPGFVRLPGSAACVRIGGRVSTEYGTGPRRIARDTIAGFGASGRASADIRTETEYGPVRTYLRVRAGRPSP